MTFLKVDKNNQITEWGEVADNEKGDYGEDMILLPEGMPEDVNKDKIFEMIDEISRKNNKRVFKLYDDLLYLKTDAMSIISLTLRQYGKLLKTSEVLETGKDLKRVASYAKVQEWQAKKYMAICDNYTTKQLVEKVNFCMDADRMVKTGRMKKELAAEMMILNLLK